jgi:hypothetical protein
LKRKPGRSDGRPPHNPPNARIGRALEKKDAAKMAALRKPGTIYRATT